jgi:two-component system, OmpR family, response regulator QseB
VRFDLVVLDLGLPGCSGLEVLRRARAARNDVPVLVLTARDTVAERILGLDSGADDYLVKPFDMAELYARLRTLLRRALGRASPELTSGRVRLDEARHHVTNDGEPLALSAREYAVLRVLLGNAGRVVTKRRLEEALYGWGGEIESNAVEVYVHRLRKKLGHEFIRTLRGVGYLVDRAAR